MASSSNYPIDPKYFKEESVMEILKLTDNMVNMERIINIMVDPSITSVQLIETEEGTSSEGQNLTGYKLLVEVKLSEKVLYVGDLPSQPVQGAHFEVNRTVFIVPPASIDGVSICDLMAGGRLEITPYVEKVYARLLDCRTIQKCICLFVNMSVK